MQKPQPKLEVIISDELTQKYNTIWGQEREKAAGKMNAAFGFVSYMASMLIMPPILIHGYKKEAALQKPSMKSFVWGYPENQALWDAIKKADIVVITMHFKEGWGITVSVEVKSGDKVIHAVSVDVSVSHF